VDFFRGMLKAAVGDGYFFNLELLHHSSKAS